MTILDSRQICLHVSLVDCANPNKIVPAFPPPPLPCPRIKEVANTATSRYRLPPNHNPDQSFLTALHISSHKEHKQRTILAKTTDSDAAAEPPKILLKAKDKPAAAAAAPTAAAAAPASPTITIASRGDTAPIIIAKPPPNPSAQQSSNAPAVGVAAAAAAAASPAAPFAHTATPSPFSSAAAATTANRSPPASSSAFVTPPAPPPPAQTSTTAAAGDQSSPPGAVAAAAEKVPRMPGPQPLINEHQQLCAATLSTYLLDTNHQFFVVGVLGTQSAGKSTLLNMLLLPAKPADTAFAADRAPYDQLLQLLSTTSGRFPVQRSNGGWPPATATGTGTAPTAADAVQMYVTDERHVLLDCTPVLCNGQRRADAATGELDDLRLCALLLSVCQTVLVADSGAAANLALLRLLHMAELMKPSLDLAAAAATPTAALATAAAKYPEQLHAAGAHYPSVMFVHNRAERRHLEPEHAERMRRLYARCFAQSRLRTFGGSVRAAMAGGAEPAGGGGGGGAGGGRRVRELPLNLFTMPRFATATATATSSGGGGKGGRRSAGAGGQQQDVVTYAQQFRRWVLMAPRVPFVASPGAPPMSEKSWAVLVQAVWESHKGSYFMRKYEAELAARAAV